MTITLPALQQQRRDTASNWASNNPTLLAGEWGYETDTKKFKIGDGTTAYTSLDYVPIPDTNRLLTGNLTVGGNFTVNGTTTTVNTSVLDVEDINITLGKVSTPSDTTANGGGITLQGDSDKTFNWLNSTDSWTSSENIALPDNKKLQLGTGQDLQVFWDGSAGFVTNQGGGNLHFNSDTVLIKSADNTKSFIRAYANSSVELFHNNVKKAETTADGLSVTGKFTSTGNIDLPDDADILLGDNDEFRIFHDESGSLNYIQSHNDAPIIFRGNNSTLAQFNPSQGTILKYNGSTVFETLSTGIDVTGNIVVSGNVDGRSIAADGTKLDGIEVGATADQTASEIVSLLSDQDIATTGSATFGGSATFASDGYLTTTTGITVENTQPGIIFSDTSANPDFIIQNRDGSFAVRDITNAANRFLVDMSNGNITATGNMTISGTVNGVSIATRDTLFGGLTASSGVLSNGVTATTQGSSDNTTKVATTAYVTTAISNLINGAPSALDTLNELAAAMNDNASFSTTVTNNLATKMPLAGGEFTGNVTFSGSQTVDGRDLSVDGAKLDTIESNATADQTASEILTLIKTVDGSGSGLDADELDGIGSSQFLRSDAADTATGDITFSGGLGAATIAADSDIRFVNSSTWTGNSTAAKIQLYNNVLYVSGGSSGIIFRENAANRWSIDGDGHFDPAVDSTYDIGENAKRVRNIYADTYYGDGSNLTGLTASNANTLDNLDSTQFLRSDTSDTMTGSLTIGDGSAQTELLIKKADNNVSDHLQFYNGTTRIGEIGCEDTTWLRINQETAKNIYTPRYIRADAGFFVDGTTKGINGSGNFIGGTIAGASDYGTLLRSDTSDTMTGDLTMDGNVILASDHYVQMHNAATKDKYRLWNNSTYAIGMDDAMSFGGLNDYAMTFQMNSDADRGFVFLDSSHSDAQGAMSLTTNGKMCVAHSLRVGYGESDTTTPGATYRLDVSGDVQATSYYGDGSNLTNISGSAVKNLVINGAMNIAQRGTSSTTANYETVDRFMNGRNGLDEATTQSQHALSTSDTPYAEGFRFSYHITNGNQTSAGADDALTILHAIEAQDMATSGWNYKSSSDYITLQFWVKSSVAQNFYFVLRTVDGTAQNYVMETGTLSANTWTKITKTIAGHTNLVFDNDADRGLVIEWSMFRGTNTTGTRPLNAWAALDSATRTPDMTSTWYTTNDATFEITGVQLEVGSNASPFQFETFAETLKKCQRYCYVNKLNNGDNTGIHGSCFNTTTMRAMITFPVPMRDEPTYTGNGVNCRVEAANSSPDFPLSTIAMHRAPLTRPVAYTGMAKTTSSITAGQACLVVMRNNNGKMTFDAEI